jgi:hypothetical protein
MGTLYRYINHTKHEWFSAAAFGENNKLSGLGLSLSSRAFHLLLVDRGDLSGAGRVLQEGYWAGDSVALVGDDDCDDETWRRYRTEFIDLDADVILFMYRRGGFDDIAAAAERSDCLFMQLCYLVTTHQAPPSLEPDMKRRFGGNFLHRHKQLWEELTWFEPRNVGLPPER